MSKKSVLDAMRVSRPCSEDWDQMTGNDRVRFCSHCAKDVNNISEMTPKQAVRLARASGGNICIRYKYDPVTKAPIFADRFHQISRRAPALASGAMAASIAFSTAAYAQGDMKPVAPKSEIAQLECPDASLIKSDIQPRKVVAVGSVSETVLDLNGAVIPGINLTLTETTGGIMVANVEHKGALAKAVASEDIDDVMDLISKGENVNQREDDKTTPLFVAVENGNKEIVETLLNFGAKINARNKEKQTPLMQMDGDATAELVNLLVRFGAKINLIDNDGNTALMQSARSASSDVVKALIDAGADVNLVNKDGRSALMQAADDGNLESVRALLMAGAKVNLRDKEGESAWDLTGDAEIEALLVSFGAETDSPAETRSIEVTTTTQEPEPVQETPSPQEVPVD